MNDKQTAKDRCLICGCEIVTESGQVCERCGGAGEERKKDERNQRMSLRPQR